jgi:serine/threonine protein phosphatase PrpC
MRITPGNAQHIGSRKEQQDDFGFSDIDNVAFVNHGGVLAVVTDGMGGLAQGQEASQIAKQTMLREYEEKSTKKTIPQALIRALSVANAKVLELAKQAGLEGQTGTTLVAAVINDSELYWVSVGDSRIYLYRQGEMIQLTTDHDYGRQLDQEAALGQISPDEAAAHPQRQALISYLGLPFLSEIDRNEDPVILEAGDRILLCSDGLYKTIPGEEIVKFLDRDPQQAAEGLIEATLARGKTNQDNVTVAILACEPDLEIDSFSYLMSFIELYGKIILIILMVVIGLGSAAYLAAQYYHSPRTHAKGVATDNNELRLPNFTGPPLVEGESPIPPRVWKTRNDTDQEMTEEERPKVREKKSRKKGKRSQAEVSTP